MRQYSTLTGILLWIAVIGAPVAAWADPILVDQRNLGPVAGGFGVTSDTSLGQTFTVGTTGVLRQFDLYLRYPHLDRSRFTDPLVVELRSTSGGLPGDTVLHGFTLPVEDVPTTNTLLAFTGLELDVSAGDLLAIVLSTGASGNFAWLQSCCYAGGNPFVTRADLGPGWHSITRLTSLNNDFMFQTWVEGEPVEAAPVPEPGTMLLLGTGTAWVAARRRRGRSPAA